MYVGKQQMSLEFWANSEPVSEKGSCVVATLDIEMEISWKVSNCSVVRKFICKNRKCDRDVTLLKYTHSLV